MFQRNNIICNPRSTDTRDWLETTARIMLFVIVMLTHNHAHTHDDGEVVIFWRLPLIILIDSSMLVLLVYQHDGPPTL